MSARVYVPTTLSGLATYVSDGEIPASAARVTAPEEDEESEYDALMAAADASAELLDGPGRRVVLVAQLAQPPQVAGAIPFRFVVAVHVDTDEGAHLADPDADLAWYATQEIPDLLRR